jgi:8-oxo-dGTP diphosphatase
MSDRTVIRVVSAEIQRDGMYLLTQRSARAVLPLLWEFPGGRVRAGESDQAALARAVKGRVGVEIDVGGKVLEVDHSYDDYDLVLVVYKASVGDREPFALSVNAVAWVEPSSFGDYPFPGADQKSVELLLSDG